MPVLNRDEFISTVRKFVGETPDDAGMSILQNMTETFDHMSGDTHTDWKEKYEQNDKDWRKKYADAFNQPIEQDHEETPDEHAASIRIKDLFIRKE